MPSMGATVNELTVVSLRVQPGARVVRGQKLGELESDKSVFEYEAPCDGTVKFIHVSPGDAKPSGSLFMQIETSDSSLLHLKSKGGASAGASQAAPKAAAVWTPRAIKLAKEAGLDPEKITEIEASGPGGRVSGDDVDRYIAKHRK